MCRSICPRGASGLAPPRVPVKVPLFGKLYTGQVEFASADGNVELRLANFASEPSVLRTLTIQLPEGADRAKCIVQQGTVGGVKSGQTGDTILSDVVIPSNGLLRLRWE